VLLTAAGVGGWLGLRGTSASESGPLAVSSSPAPPSTAPSAGTGSPSPGGPPSAGPSRSPSAASLPKGWRRHTDTAGFSLALPPGWRNHQRNAQNTRIYFRGPDPSVYLQIDLTPSEDADPVRAWEKVADLAVAEGRLKGYRLVGISPVRYRGRPAADWEFTWTSSTGTVMHVRDRGFRTPGGRSFAVYWQTPEEKWHENLPLLETVLRTFRPA
jgi:hypothetical protein